MLTVAAACREYVTHLRSAGPAHHNFIQQLTLDCCGRGQHSDNPAASLFDCRLHRRNHTDERCAWESLPKPVQPWEGIKNAQVWGPVCPAPEQSTVSSDELVFPGQIKVTVIRELKAVEVAG